MRFPNLRRLARARVSAAALAAAVMPTAASAGVQAHIALQDRIQVRRAEVTLADVAQIRTRDLGMIRKLMALSLGPAPRPGEAAVLDARTIARFVRVRLQMPEAGIEWEGASHVRIERSVQSVAGDQLVAASKQQLEGWLRGRYENFSVTVSQDVAGLTIPAGDMTLRVRPLPDNQLPTSRMVMWLDIWVADEFVRTVTVPFDVTVFQPAWVARHDMRPGDALRQDDFELRVVDVARLAGKPATSVPEGFRARRSVLAHHPLLESALQAVPMVARGQPVVLRSTVGSIALEARAEALQDGWQGQRVRVRMPASKESIMARVVDGGLVELVR